MTIGILMFFRASRIFLFALLLVCLCSSALAGRKRKDVVMNNGDRFTGEVKRLQNGLLYVETEYVSGNIALDWESSAIRRKYCDLPYCDEQRSKNGRKDWKKIRGKI